MVTDQAPIVFPFSAIVGQEPMKRALLAAAVDPGINGVLVRGHRGTAKTTAARGLAALLPPLEVVRGCVFSCDPAADPSALCTSCRDVVSCGKKLPTTTCSVPFVNLPLGATEDRLIGALSLEAALSRGEHRFEPGLLAQAHRGFLYVDEVNLLPDHLVDLILDAAASGVSHVEREGISLSHRCHFVLVGTMNPEEGDLRPQLLDRFGLCVEVSGTEEPQARAIITRRRVAFDSAPADIAGAFAEQQAQLAQQVATARRVVHQVDVPESLWAQAARFSLAFEVEGHRADVAMIKTARALAALDGRKTVTIRDLGKGAELALPHRMARDGLDETPFDFEKLEDLIIEAEEHPEVAGPGGASDLKKNTSSP